MMKRLFTAIKIVPDEDFLKIYYSLRHLLQNEKINWVEPDRLHFTLKFFGETPESKIENIKEVLKQVSDELIPFNITISKTNLFGSSYKPRVIWFGFEEEEQLKKIGEKIIMRLDDAGFPSDRQNFVPHLTIGRIKKIEHPIAFQKVIDKFRKIRLQKFEVKDFVLFESKLEQAGPVYLEIEKFHLVSNKA